MGRVFLYLGEEEFLKKEAIEKLRNSYGGRVDYYSFSPGEEAFNMEEIMRQARTKNLFSPRQIIVIRDIDKISLSDRELLIAYVRNPVEHTDLVLLTKLKMKKLNDSDFLWIKDLINEPALKTKEFFPLVDKDLQNWIVAEAGKYGKRISPPAVSLLISKLGNNTFLISLALEKTSLYI
ncbi:MAG: DNA polymerase III subunit delta, partial [Candidatus Omnitrophota bacterium]